jgi:hypothetical protein
MEPTDRIAQRAYRYWYDDGIVELLGAGLFGLLALYFYVQALAPQGPVAGLSALLLPVIVIGGMFGARRIVGLVKQRFTYPRTGYVSYQKPSPARRRRSAALAAAIGALVAFWTLRSDVGVNWLLLIQSLAFALGFAVSASRFGLWRFWSLAGLAVLAGAWASRTGWSIERADAAFFAALALGLLVSGAWTLWSYLRHTQPAAEA